jgi:hypothetical protein
VSILVPYRARLLERRARHIGLASLFREVTWTQFIIKKSQDFIFANNFSFVPSHFLFRVNKE